MDAGRHLHAAPLGDGEIIQEAEQAMLLLGSDLGIAHDVLLHKALGGGIDPVALEGDGGGKAAGDGDQGLILVHDMGAGVIAAAVGVEEVGLHGAGGGQCAGNGGGDACGVDDLSGGLHLGQILLDVGSLAHAVVLGHQGGGADEHVGDGGLAAAVAEAVVIGESQGQAAAEIPLAAHEHPLPGDKDMVQNGHGVADAVGVVGGGELDTGIGADGTGDQINALSVSGHREGNGPISVRFLHGAGGDNQDFVRVGSGGIVGLTAADHDAVRTALLDVHVQVGVHLLGGTLGAVTLHVGLAAVGHDIVIVIPGQVLLEPLVIFGAVLLVDLIGGNIQGVDGVAAHAALDAAAGGIAQGADHLLLLQHVIHAVIDMGEAVDGLAGEGGGGAGQLPHLGIVRERSIKGQLHDVLAAQQAGIVTAHQLAIDVHVLAHAEQLVLVFLKCSHILSSQYS